MAYVTHFAGNLKKHSSLYRTVNEKKDAHRVLHETRGYCNAVVLKGVSGVSIILLYCVGLKHSAMSSRVCVCAS